MILEELKSYLKVINTPQRLILLLVIIVFMVKFPIMFLRFFDPDEFEHLHAARSVYQGMIPYRDFFQHHTPFFYFLLSPVFMVFGDSITTIITARIIMSFFGIGIFFATFKLARIVYGKEVALFSVFFLSIPIFFFEQVIEIRPDVPSVMFWIISLVFLVRGVRKLNNESSVAIYFFLSGVMVGTAIMFTQKMLFALIGISITELWFLVDTRILAKRSKRFYLMFVTAVGALIPFFITALYFLANGAFSDFIYLNFITNIDWPSFPPNEGIYEFFRRNPFFSAFSLLGTVIATFSLRKREDIVKGRFIPLFPMFFLVYGLFIIPVPYKNYYMLFIPILAIYAGLSFAVLNKYLDRIVTAGQLRNFTPSQMILTVVFISTIAWFVFYSRFGERGIFDSNLLYPSIWVIVIIASAIVLLRRRLEYIAFFLILGLAIYPLNQMLRFFKYDNKMQLNQIRYILDNTTSDDYVFDGWTGLGLLRNHAYYYYFLSFDMRYLMTEKEKGVDVIEALKRNKPKVVIIDRDVFDLSSIVRDFILKKSRPEIIMINRDVFESSPLVRGVVSSYYKYTGPGAIFVLKEGDNSLKAVY